MNQVCHRCWMMVLLLAAALVGAGCSRTTVSPPTQALVRTTPAPVPAGVSPEAPAPATPPTTGGYTPIPTTEMPPPAAARKEATVPATRPAAAATKPVPEPARPPAPSEPRPAPAAPGPAEVNPGPLPVVPPVPLVPAPAPADIKPAPVPANPLAPGAPAPAKTGVRRVMVRQEMQNVLRQVGIFYQLNLTENGRAPARLDDFLDYIKTEGRKEHQALKDGVLVLELTSNPGSNTVLAYEKEPYTDGSRLVLLGDTAVRKMSAEEFEKAQGMK
jgi:hypothetical protein